MPIEELQEPIWEKQKGETPNQHCYFLEFLEFPTFNLKDFHQHLCEKNKKTQTNTKIVTYDTLRKWAGEKCNKWHIRKQAKRQSEKEDLLETLHELDKQDAFTILNDDNRVDKEEPTTFASQKVDMESTNKIEYEGVENLLEVFHASKDEWNKHNSE